MLFHLFRSPSTLVHDCMISNTVWFFGLCLAYFVLFNYANLQFFAFNSIIFFFHRLSTFIFYNSIHFNFKLHFLSIKLFNYELFSPLKIKISDQTPEKSHECAIVLDSGKFPGKIRFTCKITGSYSVTDQNDHQIDRIKCSKTIYFSSKIR